MVITPDGHTLIVGETAKSQFTAFDIDVNTGLLSDQRVWASLPGVNPDGCCMDAAGCMWVASPTGHGINSEEAEVSKFIRFAQGGQVLEEILPLEGNNAIACCIGTPRFSSVRSGPADGHTLFLLESKYMAGSQPEPDKALIRTVQVEVGGAQDPNNPRYCAGYS